MVNERNKYSTLVHEGDIVFVIDMALQQAIYAGFSAAFSAGLAGMGLWLWFNMDQRYTLGNPGR